MKDKPEIVLVVTDTSREWVCEWCLKGGDFPFRAARTKPLAKDLPEPPVCPWCDGYAEPPED